MDAATRDLVTWVLATMISLSVLVGLVVKFVLLPYLREHLIQPMQKVEKQVTENHHHNETPTVLDRIDDVQKQVDAIAVDIKLMAQQFKGHTDWSREWVEKTEEEIDALKAKRHWF